MALISIGGAMGWVLFGTVWGAAIIGITLNAIDLKRFSKISMVLYLVTGWAALVTFGPLKAALGGNGILLLVLGGVAYTIGVIFYLLQKKIKYMHCIWHLFVLAGSIFHFFCILFYVIM